MNSTIALVAILVGTAWPVVKAIADPLRVEANGTIHVPAFVLPESSYLNAESLAGLRRAGASQKEGLAALNACPPLEDAAPSNTAGIRKCQAEAFYGTSFYRDVRARYAVTIKAQSIAGVYTEIFAPTDGIAKVNKNRVLINLHGGGFWCCARTSSQVESIPIASVGKIKVVSIDYRQGPEYTFPAASEDVAGVYRELLRSYRPENIGLYGCSAGGALVAQSIAWFLKHNLPLPGAIGMFCFGAPEALNEKEDKYLQSDAGYIGDALSGEKMQAQYNPYYRGVNVMSPLASPGDYDDIMRRFPPSLLVTGTRDSAMSSVVVTHAQLVRLGVDAELHVWEGMSHAFLYFPDIPESREAYDVIVRFFAGHLSSRVTTERRR